MRAKKPEPKPIITQSLATRMQQFIGTVEGQQNKVKTIDQATQQVVGTFRLFIFQNERDEVKSLAGKIGMTMNEYIIEAIREKSEKTEKQLKKQYR